jgi:hypothetical protein
MPTIMMLHIKNPRRSVVAFAAVGCITMGCKPIHAVHGVRFAP